MFRSSCALYVLLVTIPSITSRPTNEEDLMTLSQTDTAVVESKIREVRQAVPSHIAELVEPNTKNAYIETFGDDEDEKGYRSSVQDKGKDGYKKYEEYHQKDSDSYGFEKHEEHGKGHKGGRSGKHSSKKASHKKESEGSPTHESYKVVEKTDEDKKKAFDDYDGGHYADSYHDGESEGYSEYDGDSGHLESEGDGESEGYTSYDSDGESEAYTAEGEEDYDY